MNLPTLLWKNRVLGFTRGSGSISSTGVLNNIVSFIEADEHALTPDGTDAFYETQAYEIPEQFRVNKVTLLFGFLRKTSGSWNDSPSNESHYIEVSENGTDWTILNTTISELTASIPVNAYVSSSAILVESLVNKTHIRAKFRYGVAGASPFTIKNINITMMLDRLSTASPGTDDHKILTSNIEDMTPGYLDEKLIAGSNVTLSIVDDGGVKKVQIDSSTGITPTPTYEVLTSDVADETPGHLDEKLIAGTNITIDIVEDSGVKKVRITGSSTGSVSKPDDIKSFTAGSQIGTAEWTEVELTDGTIVVDAFDDTTEEFVGNDFITTPSDLDPAGTVTIDAWCLAKVADATNNKFKLKFYHQAVSTDGVLNDTYDSVESGDLVAHATQGTIKRFTFTETVTNLGWLSNQMLRIKLARTAPTGAKLVDDLYKTVWLIKIPRA